MRKTAMVLATMAAILTLGAATVFAQEGDAGSSGLEGAKVVTDRAGNQTVQCTGVPCTATGNDDLVLERVGNGLKDRILLKGGDDQVRANTYTNDRDVIKGSAGFDLIYVDDGDTRDRIRGGAGRDKCYVDARSEAVSGCSRVIVQ
jgi:uncharacterized membrane protein